MRGASYNTHLNEETRFPMVALFRRLLAMLSTPTTPPKSEMEMMREALKPSGRERPVPQPASLPPKIQKRR